MRKYKLEFIQVQKMLKEFVGCGSININQLNLMDNIIAWSKEDQFHVLNDALLSLIEQRVFFSAIINISTSMNIMKERLKTASINDDNPTIAELALELMPIYLSLAPYIDEFLNGNKIIGINRISEYSRGLYRKANKFGFYPDINTQLIEAGVTKTQIKKFIESFNKNISSEIELEEEVSSKYENPN